VLPGETAGSGKLWYFTTLTCTLNCTGTPTVRRWTINAFGEIRDCPTTCATVLHQRTVRVQVEITYVTCAAGTNACPSGVTLLRWERVEP
jgi:hypothetical protein